MELIKINIIDTDRVAPLVAAFRVQSKSYKGIKAQSNIEEGKEELFDFLKSDFLIYAVENGGTLVVISCAESMGLAYG